MAGDLSDPPPGLSLRHLSRKLTKSIQSRAISDLWRRRADLDATLRRQWIRNLPGDAPARPESYHGHGEWLHCLPGRYENTLLDPVLRLGMNQRLGFPAPGTGQQCGRTPPGGKRCQHILDSYGRHAACCTKGFHTRRHDRVRDLITKLARQAGLTATTEQAMLIPDQIQEDGQPAPGSVRPIHRADVHIIEPQGSELWLDVKIHTVSPDLVVARELLREEMTKCRAYGQRDGYNLQALDRGMTPVVLEQFGRTAPGAQAIFNRIINHRLHCHYNFLSDKGCRTLMQSEPPAPSCGGRYHVHCYELHGKLMPNAPLKLARPISMMHWTGCRAPPGRHSDQHERMRALVGCLCARTNIAQSGVPDNLRHFMTISVSLLIKRHKTA